MNRALTADLTRTFIYKDKHILVVRNTFINMGWAVCHSSLRKRYINSIFAFPDLKYSVRAPRVISSRSRIFTRELKTVGVKREEVPPPETEKGLALFDR